MQCIGFHCNVKVYPIVLHPYMPFIIGKTENLDRLCGLYAARFISIKQLCPVCKCLMLESGYLKANYPHRKPAAIDRVVRFGDLVALKVKDLTLQRLSNEEHSSSGTNG